MSNHGARPARPADAALRGAAANVVPGAFGAGQQHPLKWKHVEDWKLVKRARFNAAKRLERKQSAGIVTLAVVALYGGLISVFNLMFKHRVGADVRDILEYVAVVSSWLTLIIGLTEQQKNYGANARELHDCARGVNDLQKQLAASPIQSGSDLAPFLQRYNFLVDRCRPNHDDIDYRLAEATIPKDERARLVAARQASEAQLKWALRKARALYHLNTYWWYVAVGLAPSIVGLALWLMVPPAIPAG
jgi:hypothetical protein